MEIRTPMVPVQIDKVCACTIGRMRPTWELLPSKPLIHPHVCNKCGIKENYDVSYPHITYEPSDN